jgi:predicted component of type VI protein secretion system
MEKSGSELPMLIAHTGPLEGKRWVIGQTLNIGRDANCEVIIPERQVSRFHARLTTTPEGVILEDLGSKNGTFCNYNLVNEPVLLVDGDNFQVALAQNFSFLSSDATMPLDTDEAVTVGEILASQEAEPATRLRLDQRSRRVWIGNDEILPPLSAPQFRMLEMLYEHQGKVVSRNDLIGAVWDSEEALGVSEQALDALVRRLRERISALDEQHTYVVTVRGHGLRLDNPPF